MIDFDVQRCTRRCAKTDREFQPGEAIYSVLVADGGNVVRRDYSVEAWEGPPDGAIGHWKSQMPEPHAKRAHWAPNDVMLDYFVQLEGQADKQDTRYILTLLMTRRRIVRLEETETGDTGPQVLVVFCPANETEYRVPAVMPDAARAREIQEELAKLLDADAA